MQEQAACINVSEAVSVLAASITAIAIGDHPAPALREQFKAKQ
jgi:hypothetical protein